jgi:hypothetical protein
VYRSLYGPEGLVIFDHPYNAESEREANSLDYCGRARRSPILVCRYPATGSACEICVGQSMGVRKSAGMPAPR